MIRDKIQTVLQAIVNSYSPSVDTDVLPATPFCVHDEKITNTLRDKKGIYGFEYALGVIVIGDTDAQVDPVVETIIETIEMLTDTVIEACSFESSDGLQFDTDIKKYHHQLNFKVVTNNL